MAGFERQKIRRVDGGTAELFFDDALATHSIKRSDIPVVSFTTPGPPILQALQNRDIDCTVVYEPFGAVAVASGYGYYPPVNLADNSFRGLNSVWAVNNNFLAKNAEFVKEAVGVMIKAAEYYPQHREKMETDFQKWLEYKPEVIKVGADRFELDTKMYFESALRTAQAMKELGFIRNVPEKAKLSHYFNYSFLIANTGKSAAELGQDK